MRPKTEPTASQPPVMPAMAARPPSLSNVRRFSENQSCMIEPSDLGDTDRSLSPVMTEVFKGLTLFKALVALLSWKRF